MRWIDKLNIISLILGLIALYAVGGILLVLESLVLLVVLIAIHEMGHLVMAKHYHVFQKLIIDFKKARFAVKIGMNARVDEAIIILAAGPIITLLFTWLLSIGLGEPSLLVPALIAVTTGAMDIIMIGIFIHFIAKKKLTMSAPTVRIMKLTRDNKFMSSIFAKDERVNKQ